MISAILLVAAACSGQTPAGPAGSIPIILTAIAEQPSDSEVGKAESTAPAPAPALWPPAERWFLMKWLQGTWPGAVLDDSHTQILGWTDMSFTGSSDRVSNLPLVFNDRANEFLLQQQWMRLEHPLVTSGTFEPTFGYRLDVLVGSDYRWMAMRGLFNEQLLNSHGQQNLYGVDPVEFYVNGYFPTWFQGVELRAGRTYNPWGVESLEAVSTPLMSRSYTYNNTPFTLMGLGAYVTFNPRWSGAFLLASGNDVLPGPAAEPRFFGLLTWKLPGNQDTLALGTTLGRGRFNAGEPFVAATDALPTQPAGQNNFNAFDLVFTHSFTSRFTYTLETMYAYQTVVPANVPGGIVRPGAVTGTAHWASGVHYFKHTFTSRLNGIIRAETFDDFDGQRTGSVGLYTDVTVGLQFYFTKSMLLRPEIRFDHNDENRPFEGHHSLLTAGGDLIIRW